MSANVSVQRLDSLRSELARKHDLGVKWRDIARDYPGVPAGTLCAIAKGREPHKPAIRAALGLPVTAPAPVCPRCGVVHVRKCQASKMPAGWEVLIDFLKRHEQAKRRAEARVYGRRGKSA